MTELDFLVYGMLLTFALIGTTEFVIGLILLKEYDKQQKEEKSEEVSDIENLEARR